MWGGPFAPSNHTPAAQPTPRITPTIVETIDTYFQRTHRSQHTIGSSNSWQKSQVTMCTLLDLTWLVA